MAVYFLVAVNNLDRHSGPPASSSDCPFDVSVGRESVASVSMSIWSLPENTQAQREAASFCGLKALPLEPMGLLNKLGRFIYEVKHRQVWMDGKKSLKPFFKTITCFII